jgi:hypothetical protein
VPKIDERDRLKVVGVPVTETGVDDVAQVSNWHEI